MFRPGLSVALLALAVAVPPAAAGPRAPRAAAVQKVRPKVSPRRPARQRLPGRGALARRAARAARTIPLPNIRQTTDYTCGPASLLAVFRYFGVAPRLGEMELAAEVGTTTEHGSDATALVRVARDHGLDAELKTGMRVEDLSRATRAGTPVLVLYQAWADDPAAADHAGYDAGHFSVVVGVDARNVYLQDPWIGGARGVLPRAEFERRWHGMERGLPGGEQRLRQPGILLRSDRPPVMRDARTRLRPIE